MKPSVSLSVIVDVRRALVVAVNELRVQTYVVENIHKEKMLKLCISQYGRYSRNLAMRQQLLSSVP